jgi:hypothetical protein
MTALAVLMSFLSGEEFHIGQAALSLHHAAITVLAEFLSWSFYTPQNSFTLEVLFILRPSVSVSCQQGRHVKAAN